jgi:hypothetical protein
MAAMHESALHHCCRVPLRGWLFLSRVGWQQAFLASPLAPPLTTALSLSPLPCLCRAHERRPPWLSLLNGRASPSHRCSLFCASSIQPTALQHLPLLPCMHAKALATELASASVSPSLLASSSWPCVARGPRAVAGHLACMAAPCCRPTSSCWQGASHRRPSCFPRRSLLSSVLEEEEGEG